MNGKDNYMRGFGNNFVTEAVKGTIPELGFTPQKCPHGLYAEQISGTSFTKVKSHMKHTWCYRIKPSVDHGPWERVNAYAPALVMRADVVNPEQIRWNPLPQLATEKNWLEGLFLYAGAGTPELKTGLRIYGYVANKSMEEISFSNSDGELLIVPQSGTMILKTEMGIITVESGWICVIPRGVRFSVECKHEIRGFVCEVFDSHFELPPMGVIGTNGLANPHDFEIPVAAYENRECKWTCYQKFGGELFKYEQDHSPYDVVGWVGNLAPYRYDLSKFCVINTVSYDHLDPSIFCVLTAQTVETGVAVCDFVIFPPRWMVAEKTFRPPYYHKNVMSEFMGNIKGVYDAKEVGFVPGAASLHNVMVAHGPEVGVFEKALVAANTPQPPVKDSLSFMFESTYMLKLSSASNENNMDRTYQSCWKGFKKHFTL